MRSAWSWAWWVAMFVSAGPAWAQIAPWPTEPVNVQIDVVNEMDVKRQEQLRERFKGLAEQAELVQVLEGKGFVLAVKKDQKLTLSDLKSTVESTEDGAELTLGEVRLQGRVRFRFDSELTTRERKNALTASIGKLKARSGVTRVRATKEGGIEFVVAAPGIPLSEARALFVKTMKLGDDVEPFYEVTWHGPKDPPKRIGGGCEDD